MFTKDKNIFCLFFTFCCFTADVLLSRPVYFLKRSADRPQQQCCSHVTLHIYTTYYQH